MAQKLYEETNIRSIADAIRAKNGSTDTYKTSEMAAAISAITTGGGGGDIILDTKTLTNFVTAPWVSFLEENADKIKFTSPISETNYLCSNATISSLPLKFSIDNFNFHHSFEGSKALTTLPTVTLDSNTTELTTAPAFGALFSGCQSLVNAENFLSGVDFSLLNNYVPEDDTAQYNNIFNQCYSLRTVPSWFYKIKTAWPNGSAYTAGNNVYYQAFKQCYALDKINGLQVQTGLATTNLFYQTFFRCSRLSSLTFEQVDYGVPWQSAVTIDLSQYVGYAYSASHITDYNSGITADKEVTDDATYQALKNDPDWFTTNIAYSRYNHDSAVETLNSLPTVDGGTIKFKGAAGSATDGGAINTLTADEKAVAEAKGWTVTIS